MTGGAGNAALTCENRCAKNGPGGACDANPVLTPDAAEALMNHALPATACQQVAR